MIPTFHEPARDIPVAKEVDVLVVGAGPAGIGAAVRAAREGAQTLLVESQGMLGGTWTSSMQVHATCFFSGGRVIVGGLVREIIDRLARDGHAEDPERKIQEYPTSSAVHFEPEWMKGCLDDVVVESGAELLLHAFCAGAIVDAGGVGGIVVESKSGRQAIRAAVTIDCTGDADVAHAAGVPTRRGRESDGQCQPVNTTCLLSQVDRERSVAWVEANRGLLRKLSEQAQAAGELDRSFAIGRLGARTCYPDVTYHNIGHVFNIDCTRAEDLTRAELEGRRQVRQIYQFFRQYVPGYEHCRLAAVAPTVGRRESRRIVGVATLTRDDVVAGRKFEDGVARHNYYVDVHSADPLLPEPGMDNADRPAPGDYYEVPYGCLVPQTVDRLLVAGRCISADRAALGSARTTVCCMALGEAAGLAATLAVRERRRVRDVDGAALKQALLGSAPFQSPARPFT